jgi:hypothetical protein
MSLPVLALALLAAQPALALDPPGATTATPTGADSGTGTDSETGTGTEAEATPPDLRGDWRMDLYVVSHARIPVLGTTTILAHTVLQVQIDGSAEAPFMHTRPCSLTPQTTRPIATTVIPQAFVDNLPPKHFPLLLSQHADGAWHFTGDMQPQYVGWNRDLYTPTPGELVPQDKDHPAVTDFEGDGQPGATVRLDAPLFGEIDIYVVQTAHTKLSAPVGDARAISGQANVSAFSQRTIAASNRLFVSNPDITLDSAQSSFRLGRVPPGTTCRALRAGAGAGTHVRPEDVRPRD